jgi:murein L,D-transpeptidase YcbB/YkuD
MPRRRPQGLEVRGSVLIGLVLFVGTAIAENGSVRERLRARVEAASAGAPLAVGEDLVLASATLRDFYERRSFQPAWSRDGIALPASRALLDALRAATVEGLNPDDYHFEAIRDRLRPAKAAGSSRLDGASATDLDLISTDAFLLYASHLLAGHLDPETIDPEWHARRREADLAEHLQRALAEDRVREALEELLPPQAGYRSLRASLRRYRDLAAEGGWPEVPAGPTLREGDAGPRVQALAERLRITGELDGGHDPALDAFDVPLAGAVARFQRRHGLEVDGAVGKETLAALNVPAEARARQIVVNLERWRWLPQDLGSRHVRVNIADFHLDALDSGETVLSMRAIVGRSYRRTPVFSDAMTYLVLNPSWEVPPKLAANDVLPQIQKDPEYLARMGFKVLQGWGAGETIVDPASVDWGRLQPSTFRYRLRQMPGPKNALGQVKFMFPNKFNVYLHDTPSRELFAKTERAFSSGCIRIEKPLDLAVLLLSGQPAWDRAGLLEALGQGAERTVRLAAPVPVHLLYWTAWVDADGTTHFRKDLYGRDRRVLDALREPPPEPGELP